MVVAGPKTLGVAFALSRTGSGASGIVSGVGCGVYSGTIVAPA
jgi:hypothetical protein